MNLKKVVEGEIDSEFKPEPIRNNFNRILGDDYNYSKIARDNKHEAQGLLHSDVDSDDASYYEITGDNIDGKVRAIIAIYPYRSGSKINYAFLHEYSLTNDGKIHSSQDNIKAVKKRLEAIVND